MKIEIDSEKLNGSKIISWAYQITGILILFAALYCAIRFGNEVIVHVTLLVLLALGTLNLGYTIESREKILDEVDAMLEEQTQKIKEEIAKEPNGEKP